MKKLAAAFLIIPLAGYSGIDKDWSTHTNNENRKEYQYDVHPNLLFWNEGGRPHWRQKDQAYSTYTYPMPTTMRELVIIEDVQPTSDLDSLEEEVYFANNSSKLTREGKEQLEDLSSELTNDNLERLYIHGFSSKSGPKEYNKKLSRAWAEAVKNYLSALGVDEMLMDIQVHGESNVVGTEEKSRRALLDVRFKSSDVYSE